MYIYRESPIETKIADFQLKPAEIPNPKYYMLPPKKNFPLHKLQAATRSASARSSPLPLSSSPVVKAPLADGISTPLSQGPNPGTSSCPTAAVLSSVAAPQPSFTPHL
jgi:hypothetical protein